MKKLILIAFLAFGFISQLSAQLANWNNLGLTDFPLDVSPQINGFCRITQMDFHPTNPDKFYAVTAEGGLFISENAGQDWTVTPGTDGFVHDCASVCIDRTNDQVIFLGTGDPNYYQNGTGILKSTDGGQTFSATGLVSALVIEILQHPTQSNIFVAATNKGLYRSSDGGNAWTAVSATNIPFCDLQQNKAANSLILYAGTNENAPRLYRSTDFGSTWTQITSGIFAPTVDVESGCRIAVTAADPDVVYFSQVGGGGMVFKSTDSGLNFTVQKTEGAPWLTFYNNDPGSSGQGNYNNVLYADQTNPNRLWLQSQNTWLSNDGGLTWSMQLYWSTILHTDHHYMIQHPDDPGRLYSCNDGGVWVSTDSGNSWTPKSDGLYAYEVANNTGKSSHTDPNFVSIGTQDNGRLYRNANGWYTTIGGDDYEDREFDYLPNGGYFYNMDHNTRTRVPNAGTATYGIPTATVEALGFNRTNPELAFMGNGNIYRTENLSAGTPTWIQISTFNKTIKAIHSCIADPNRLYVITSDQLIYVSTNATTASPTFTSYNLPSASNTIASIAAVCNNANLVYISINNQVYRSADGGQTWTNITYNLPAVNHRKILSEEFGGSEELVFVATNNAVYYKKSGQTNWTNYSTNLPARRSPTDFSMFDDGTNRARIRYATYGRAIWETGFDNLRQAQAEFTADRTNNLCLTDGLVRFTDLSTGGATTWSWTFPGGTPATSTQQNPVVIYSTPGIYDVTLTVTTPSGPVTATKTAYINAGNASVGGGVYTVGVGGDFSTLSSAVNYWNSNCINGDVFFHLTDANYPSETFPIVINANNPSSRLTIQPTGNTTISGTSSVAIIQLNAADRVTINGSTSDGANTICPRQQATRNLTIQNNSTGTSSAVIWIQSNGSDGATDNTIKNCVIRGQAPSTTRFGIGSGSSLIDPSSFGNGNDNNTFINNDIGRTQYGIYSGGASTVRKNKGTVIELNKIDNTAPNNIFRSCILVKFEDGISISGNTLGNTNLNNNGTTPSFGIACGAEPSGTFTSWSGSEVTGAKITHNTIDNILRSGSTSGSAAGICVASVNTTTGSGPNIIANNTISQVRTTNSPAGHTIAGIIVGGGRNCVAEVKHNSINLTGAVSAAALTYGVIIGGNENTSNVTLKNNLVINQLATAAGNYAIGLGYNGPYFRLQSDYNIFYTAGARFAVVGGLNNPAGERNSLPAWQTESSGDAHSQQTLPEFVSASDLHLVATGAQNIQHVMGYGQTSDVADDVDCETRHPEYPAIGADETCGSPEIPSVSASANPVCPGTPVTLSVTAGALNSATDWKWYAGACGGAPIGSGTSISVSPTATTTYYVRGEGRCVTPGACGSITVTVSTAPGFSSCPSSTSVNTAAGLCAASVSYAPVLSGTEPINLQYTFAGATTGSGSGTGSGASFNTGVTTVTITATNACGSQTCSFTITVTDNEAPAIACPPLLQANTDPGFCTAVVNYTIPDGTDNCPGAATVQTAGLGSGAAFPLGNTTNTFVVTAANGQTASCSFSVQVSDMEAPLVTCRNISANIAAGGQVAITPDDVYQGGSDNCGSVNLVEVMPHLFTCSELGANLVTLLVNDGHGNTATCTASVVITDTDGECFSNLPPVAVCRNITVNADANCLATVAANEIDNGSSDPENGPLGFSLSPAGPFAFGTTSVTLTVTDNGGLIATCTATVTVNDNTAPTVVCKNAIVALNTAGSGSLSPADVFQSGADNCGVVNPATVVPSTFTCSDIGVQSVTLTVNDGHGNTAGCTASVTVSDNLAPTVVCKNAVVALNTAGSGSLSPADVFQSGADNCGVVNPATVAPSIFTCSDIGVQTVTLTVNDGHGNTAGCTASVTVSDNLAPTVVCKNAVVALNAAGSGSLSPADVFQSGADNCGVVNPATVAPSTFTCSDIGVQTVTLTVNDGHGNTAGCTASVTVSDNLAPTVVCKNAVVTLNAAGSGSLSPADVFQSGTDNCGVVNPAAVAPSTFTCSNIGVQTVTLTANDGHGNTAGCTASVTVNDNQPPTVICKIKVDAPLNAQGIVTITPADAYLSGSDNCGVINLVSISPATFSCAQIGTHNATLTVNDGHGNSASCNTTVSVTDLIAPTMLCRNVTLTLNGIGQATLAVAQVNNGSFDNCTLSTLFLSQTTFTCAHIGANNVILYGRDQSLNQGQCVSTVTVVDATVPMAKCKNATVSLGANGSVTPAPSVVDNGSSDNCAFTLSLTPNTFTCMNVGVNTVVLRATDGSGNSASCTASLTVRDVTAPVAKCKNATVFLDAVGAGTLTVAQIDNGSSDACGLASMSLNKTQFNCSDLPGSAWPVILTLRDMHNNTSSCTGYVTVRDNIAPHAVCSDQTILITPGGTATVYGSSLAAASTDNCSVWSYSPIARVYTAPGTYNLTVTVRDWSGNAATCVSVISVEPAQMPGEREVEAAEMPFVMYPNPADSRVMVAFTLPAAQSFALRLFDMSGRMIYQREESAEAGDHTIPIEISQIPPGVYQFDFQTPGAAIRRLLLVNR